ncbi:MAG: hypothetical protein M5U34_36850 [Chloroflexi bacterium]|nr:hypothetical protein [Chloroflexota bacterium]
MTDMLSYRGINRIIGEIVMTKLTLGVIRVERQRKDSEADWKDKAHQRDHHLRVFSIGKATARRDLASLAAE